MTKIRIVCENRDCSNYGEEINAVTGEMSEEDIDLWFEAYGNGGEDPEDHCPLCGLLGVAQDPEEVSMTTPGRSGERDARNA